jgi:predicted nucleotidyltransferase
MIPEKERQIIVEEFKPYSPIRLGIFGSYARDENHENSDLDILYDCSETIDLFSLVALKNNLERQLNKSIDLVSKKYLHPLLKDQILKDLKVFYG